MDSLACSVDLREFAEPANGKQLLQPDIIPSDSAKMSLHRRCSKITLADLVVRRENARTAGGWEVGNDYKDL